MAPSGGGGGSGFWEGGGQAYLRTLAEEHKHAVKDLRVRIAGATTEAEKKALQDQLAELEAEYRRKLEQARWSLF